MILFFGTRLRRRVIADGTFACPFCGTQRRYAQVRSRTWAHVFWIPLFPVGPEHESFQCMSCHADWAPLPAPEPGAVEEAPQQRSPDAAA